MDGQNTETLVVVVFPDGRICTASLDQQSAVSTIELLAPPDLQPVEAPLVLLQMACSLLPECMPKFHAFKAYHALKRSKDVVNDRMKVTAEPSSDELPF